jgi:hypothetical protein
MQVLEHMDAEQTQRLIQQSLQLYAGLKARVDGVDHNLETKFDAGVTGMLAQALRYYDPDLLRTEYQPFRYADPAGLVPENPTQMPGVDTVEKQWIDRVGAWKMVGPHSTNTEAIDVNMRSVRYGAKYFEAHIMYTTQELDRMAMARSQNNVGVIVDIVREKMRAVTEAYEQLRNSINSLGLPRQGIYGLHTHPNISRITAAYQLGLGQSAENNIAVLKDISTTIRRRSKQATAPNTLIMPDGLAQELSAQQYGTAGQISTLQWFLKNDMYIKDIEVTPEADTAGTGGVSIIHAYRREATRIESMTPKRMTQKHAPYIDRGAWRIDFDAQLSGVHANRPLDHLIMENVYAVA